MWHPLIATRRQIGFVVTMVAVAAGNLLSAAPPSEAPPGWRLVWSDDFDSFDDAKWQPTTKPQPATNETQAYLPQQVSVHDGKLEILSERVDRPPFRSGQVVSKRAHRLGRWEIRAKIPTSLNMWSTIKLLPQPSAPSPHSIDIMENHGHRPTVTASACHWGPRTPSSKNSLFLEQQTSLAGNLVSYPEGFHIYAVEWVEDQLRFYVDDVYHAILYSDEVGGFFSRQTAPMQLAIGTAITNASSDDTTIWPQRFLVDWVRVYERWEKSAVLTFTNGSFEKNDGTLAGWHVFGSRVNGDPNVLAHREAVKDGKSSLKLFGPLSGGNTYSGVSQGISVSGGDTVRAKLSAMVRSTDSIAKTDNRATIKIEFYNRFGDYFGGPAMLGFEERTTADGSTPNDVWKEHKLVAKAPSGTVEARLSIVFAQPTNKPGAVHIDDVKFARIED